MIQNITIHTDGGARGNPGPAAIGVVIESDGTVIHSFGMLIGSTTNNVAEYTAVEKALEWIKKNLKIEQGTHIQFFIDSLLIVNQLNGIFKIKNADLRQLVIKIQILQQQVGGVITYTSIPREQNVQADLLVNQALDNA